MRKVALIMVAALSLAACSQDATAPTNSSDLDVQAGAFGTALTAAGGYEAAIYESRLANGLPDDLKLTAEQKEKIKALVKAFEDATRADREALKAILHEATGGRKPNREEAKKIFDKTADIRARLAAAEAKLKADIDAVLTPEQRAWIASHTSKRCDPSKFMPLSDAQKQQIRALEAAFEQSNKADLDAVKAAYEEVKAAGKAGKSREEIAAILERVKPAIARLAAGRIQLREQITAVLTPEQKASGCLPLG
ncbi:MAG: Spy/CpxP family protein refolding chaperone [Gemmatimonadaceae bacterium]